MTDLDKRVVYNLLREIKRLAATASLTGALGEGTPALIQAYNKCLAVTKEKGDPGVDLLFSQLPDTAGVDQVGVAAALLASYLRPEPQLHPHDITAFNEDHYGHLEDDDEDDE